MVESSAQNNPAEPEVQTKTCSMCEKPIEVAKYRLHEVACSRQNYKCAKCGEVVPKSDREQHELDEHTEKPNLTCQLCSEFVTKDTKVLEMHKKDECKNRPRADPVQQQQPALASTSAAAASSGNMSSDLRQCPYCPIEFTADKLQEHTAYCGSKTKECPECFSTVQAWMMNSHKETGECANRVLDRAEVDDQNQIRQAMEQSAFAVNNPPASSSIVSAPMQHQQPMPQQPAAFQSVEAPGGNADDGMDENEREIARILQEEANAIDGGGAAANQYQQQQQPSSAAAAVDDGGIRAPDQSRMQVLSGPDPYYGDHADIDYDIAYAQNQQRQQQQRINEQLVSGISGGFMNAASSVASGVRNLLGYGTGSDQQQQPPSSSSSSVVQQQPQPGGDMGVMSEEERQMQLAMAASMGVDASNSINPAASSSSSAVQVNSAIDGANGNPSQSAEDEAMARAIAESMNAEQSSIEQIQAQNDLYQQQMAGGYEDEDAMLARAMAESQNQQ